MDRIRLRLWLVALAFILLGLAIGFTYQKLRGGEIRLAEGRRLYEAGRYDLAEKSYLEASELAPQRADAWYGLGMCRKNRGKPAEAADALSHATALRPDCTPWLVEYAEALQWTARYAEAQKAWERVLSLVPATDNRARMARMNIARNLASQGQPDQAADMLRKMLAEKDDNQVRFLLAEVLAWNGRFQESAAEYRRSLDSQPEK
jgi:tetratricopeptide (TPR) repeat protein